MCQPLAARKRVKAVARHAHAAGDAGHKAAEPPEERFRHVVDFLAEVKKMGPQGEAAGQLAKMLEEGVKTTIVSSSLTWTGEGLSSASEGDHGAWTGWTLEVEHSQVNQGEIATPSKVPVLWTLDKITRYTFQKGSDAPCQAPCGRWTLKVSGIKLLPFAEGREMYIDSDGKNMCAKDERPWVAEIWKSVQAQVECERKSLFKWYEHQYWKVGNFTNKDYLKSPDHKLGRILHGMYGSRTTRWAVTAGGADGWSKIVYSLVTIAPIEIERFEFLDNSQNFEEVEMAMVSKAIVEGKYGEVDLADYAGLDFYVKNGAEFDEASFESQRSQGERFARSGMNFGAMAVKGKNDDLLNSDVRGGTAKYIINFAKPCQGGKVDKNNDPTDKCRDDMGRVFWHL